MTAILAETSPRLTSLAHGGGCGCKLAPAVLQSILKGMPATASFADLMVGTDTSDDAAVWRLNDSQALVATTDFFMPVVDDPFDFGRIAATNALSDVYAMGGTPILALAIVGMPIDKLKPETIRAILEGGASVGAAAGIPLAGGHSLDSVEPIYGLVALGLVQSRQGVDQPHGQGRRRPDPHQGAGRRRPERGLQAGAPRRRRLCGPDRPRRRSSMRSARSWRPCPACMRSPTSPASACWATPCAWRRGASASPLRSPPSSPLLAGVEALARDGVRTGFDPQLGELRRQRAALRRPARSGASDLLTDPQTSAAAS